jgi:micrococcal nuclease
MFRIVRLIIRFCKWVWSYPLSPPAPSVPAPDQSTAKKKALSSAGIKARLIELPDGQVKYVMDGDTLIIAKGDGEIRVRLDSIDCPEDGQPWGDNARSGLIKLVGGRTVRLEEHGLDFHGRTLATIYVSEAQGTEWMNVNERMVTLGHAWVMRLYYDHLPWERQKRLNELEALAKSKKVGLWGTENPVPPWNWRKQQNGMLKA